MTRKSKKILKKVLCALGLVGGSVIIGVSLQQAVSGNDFGSKFGQKKKEAQQQQNQLVEIYDYEGANAQIKTEKFEELSTQLKNGEISPEDYPDEVAKVKDYAYTVPEFMEKYASAEDNQKYKSLDKDIGDYENKSSAVIIPCYMSGAVMFAVSVTEVIVQSKKWKEESEEFEK